MNKLVLSVVAAALVQIPSVALSQCGDNTCSVGRFGTGGESSGGKAQGFRTETPSTQFPGGTVTNVGNLDAGKLTVDSATASVGTTSGTFRLNPEPSVRGRGTGVFGDWAGQCVEEDIFEDC